MCGKGLGDLNRLGEWALEGGCILCYAALLPSLVGWLVG